MSTCFPVAKLGEPGVATVILGQSPPSSVYNESGRGVPFYQGKTDFGAVTPSPRVWTEGGQQFAEPGDVLISVRAPVGDVNITNTRCALGRGVAAIRAGHRADSRFLFLALKFCKPVLERQASGSTFPSINKAALLDVELPNPDIREQQTIAAVLWEILLAVRQEAAIAETAARLKRAAMRELFTRGLRGEAQKELEFGSSPESWRLVPLSDIAEVQTGAAKGRKFVDTDLVDVPYLRVANVQDGHLDLSEMKTLRIRRAETERYRLREGDVVLTEGGDFDKLGRGFIWRSELPLCIHQNHVFAVRTDRTVLEPEFFAYLAQSPYGKAYFLQVAHKTTNLACINSNKLKAFPVILPTLEEQREITDILEAIDQKIDVHKKKRAVLEDLFKSLLHKLMTGEIRVSDLDLSVLEQTSAAQVSA